MTTTRTVACDGCGVVQGDTRRKSLGTWGDVDGKDACPSCLARAVAALTNTPADQVSAQDLAEQLAEQLVNAEARAKALADDYVESEKQLKVARDCARDDGKKIEELKVIIDRLQGAHDRASALDRALAEERANSHSLQKMVKDVIENRRALVSEVLAMLGKKARAKFARRITELEVMLVKASGPPTPTGPSFFERYADEKGPRS